MAEAGSPVALATLHRDVRQRLADAGVAESALDARLLVEHFTGTGRLDLLRDPNHSVRAEIERLVLAAVARRIGGEPVHRIIGAREFHGLALELSPDTLEPRADTEVLVDLAIEALGPIIAAKGTARILDLGTGTGAIALALLAALPEATAVATDIAPGALATTMRNARTHGLDGRLTLLQGAWFAPISGLFDAILSNPPYIRTSDIAGLASEVRLHDPPAALDGGADGLDAYRVIAARAADHLQPGGPILVEIGFDQRDSVAALFDAAGWRLGQERRDLGGHVRALLFTRGTP